MMRKILPVAFLLALHAAVMLHGVWRKSASVDELGHLAAGLYALNNNDFRCNRLSPPLQNLICALPVMLFGEYRLTYDHECWKQGIWNGLGERFAEANPQTFHRDLMIARCGSMLLSILLCWLIYCWTKELWGDGPALCVLALAILEPNLIAHGQLSTSDTAPTLFFLLTGYLAWKFVSQPDWKRLLLVGISFGLTWSSKHSAPTIIPSLFLVFALVGQFHSQPIGFRWIPGIKRTSVRLRPWLLSGVLTIIVTVVGIMTIWCCYGFELGDKIQPPQPPKQSKIWMAMQVPLQTAIYFFGLENEYPVDSSNVDDPLWKLIRRGLPAFSHWEGFLANQYNAARGSNTYFLGDLSSGVKYSYYPLLYLFKTPLVLLLLYFIGASALAARRIRCSRTALIVGLAIPLVYAYVLIDVNRAYIGYRHALPIVPFFLVFLAGAAFRFLWPPNQIERQHACGYREKWRRRILCGVFIAGAAYDVVSQHPHYLAYYNALAGGPKNGNLIAVDSNLDWGQDLIDLKDYLRERNLQDAYLIYFGPQSAPAAYGIPCRKYVSQKTLQPGTYIISASMLRQYIAPYYLPELMPLTVRDPDEIIGRTLFFYRIDASQIK